MHAFHEPVFTISLYVPWYCARQGEGVSDLAITASKNALELAGVDGADIDLVRRVGERALAS